MKTNKTVNKEVDSKMILLSDQSAFSVQEAYKTLRTNVTFSLPGSGCKCIGVVSASRGDGKSSIASNLAISLAQINKRVVLIDCDLRLPTVAKKFNIPSVPGLSNYLSGDVKRIAITHDPDRKVDIIPSGNIPPDSTILISSPEMLQLIAELKESYDYIIFDFPPINIVSDAAILSGVIDGYLLVVRHETSEYQMVAETIRQMNFADAKIIGFVYNGKNSSKKYYKRGKAYYKNNYYKSYYK
jgi:capsular exopolysaccharide synthesis family protein